LLLHNSLGVDHALFGVRRVTWPTAQHSCHAALRGWTDRLDVLTCSDAVETHDVPVTVNHGVDGWMDGWMDGRTDVRMDVDGWMDGWMWMMWMDVWMDGWIDGLMDGCG